MQAAQRGAADLEEPPPLLHYPVEVLGVYRGSGARQPTVPHGARGVCSPEAGEKEGRGGGEEGEGGGFPGFAKGRGEMIGWHCSADFANRCQDLDKLPRRVGGWVGAATRLYCYRGGASGARGRFRLAWLRQPLSWLYRPFDVPSTGGGVPVTGSGMGLRRSKSSRYVGQRPKGYMAPSNLHIHGGLWR